jgi:hypothetical protein
MALVTVDRLGVIQNAFHYAWKKDMGPLEAVRYLEEVGITPDEVAFYAEWAETQPNNDVPE